MPTYLIRFIQHKSGNSKPTIWIRRVYFEKGVDMLRIAYNAGVYIAHTISFPTSPDWRMFSIDEMLCSYPINIEISYINTVRKFLLKETKSEANSFVKSVNDKHYTIIDHETGKPIALSRDMFYQFSKSYSFDLRDPLPVSKKQTPEILTPMGGAVKKRK